MTSEPPFVCIYCRQSNHVLCVNRWMLERKCKCDTCQQIEKDAEDEKSQQKMSPADPTLQEIQENLLAALEHIVDYTEAAPDARLALEMIEAIAKAAVAKARQFKGADSMALKIIATCENGHKQEISCKGMSRERVETFAGILDGTSPFYKYPPRDDPDTKIGHCEKCGKLFTCTVEEI